MKRPKENERIAVACRTLSLPKDCYISMKNNTTDRRLRLVDTDTGEVAEGIVELRAVGKTKLPLCFMAMNFEFQRLLHSLTPEAFMIFIHLCCRMSKGNHINTTQANIKKALRFNIKTVIKGMQELQRLDLIRGEHGRYMVNPRIALNGGSKVLNLALHDYHRMK